MANFTPFLRRRDLTTVALRLAGFSEFYDPELLGVFVYQDSIRTRFPSVFRQTIESKMLLPAKEKFNEEDIIVASPLLELLMDYNRAAWHPQVDQVLRLFRRGFDQSFLPEIVRASLLLSALEGMLGRFRKLGELENLVSAVVHDSYAEDVEWFKQNGRKFRNSIAHGEWPITEQNPQPLGHLINILRGLIPEFVRTWLYKADHNRFSPVREFLESISN
jgi:hypothetical protein